MKLQNNIPLSLFLSASALLTGCIEKIQPMTDSFNEEISENLRDNLDVTGNNADASKITECSEKNPENGLCASYCKDNLDIELNQSHVQNNDVSGSASHFEEVRTNYQNGAIQNLLCVDICSLDNQEVTVATNTVSNFVNFEQPEFNLLIDGIQQSNATGSNYYSFQESECKRFKLNYNSGGPENDQPSRGKESLKGLLILRQNELNTYIWSNIIFEKNRNHFYINETQGYNSVIKTLFTSPSNALEYTIDVRVMCDQDYIVRIEGNEINESIELSAGESEYWSLRPLNYLEQTSVQFVKLNDYRINCAFYVDGNGSTYSKDDQSEIFAERIEEFSF